MYRFFVDLLQPFPVLFLLVGLGVIVLWRRRVESRRRLLVLTIPFVLLTLVCLPIVAHFALATLEWGYPPDRAVPEGVDTIVVLAGYAYRPNEVRHHTLLGVDSQFRCLHAADLYRAAGGGTIVVSGGKVEASDVGPALSELMRDFLIARGVAAEDIVIEDQSSSTYENALNTAEILRARETDRVVLVTTASHLPRAVRCFTAQGIDVTPSGCQYRAAKFEWSPMMFVPSAGAALAFHTAAHEWLGLFVYWVQGKL